MAVNGVGPAQGNTPVNPSQGRARETEQVEREAPDDTAQAQSSGDGQDQIEISAEARSALRAAEAIKNVPDVRSEKVDAAVKFLEAELYNDQGILEQTAGELEPFFRSEA